MTIINASLDRTIQIGYEGEDRVTVLRFRYSADWLENGEGVFNIRVRRHGESQAYNAQLLTVDLTHMELLMTVTNVELSVKGTGEMQVVYSGADFVKKSPIYSCNVSRAVDEPVDPPAQDVYTQIIESLSGLHDTVWDIDRAVAETDARVGNLADLTTTAKTDLVSAINEVNEHGGSTVTVDDALSAVSENPVQNKVITARITSAESAIQTKADTATVSALADVVNDLDTDVQGLQTGLANKVDDVQINGTSIVTDGVANVPIATDDKLGLVGGNYSGGVYVTRGGKLSTWSAPSTTIKAGTHSTQPIVPIRQHESTFYGLAKVAGYDEKNSNLSLGTYSEGAKSAISDMLNGAIIVEGTTPTITALSGMRYICGEVATLDFTPCATGICDVVFTSGSTPTVVTLPNTVKFPDGAFTAEANKTYEINVMDGVFGVVMSWA